MRFKVPKQTYSFISPIKLEECISILNQTLSQVWNPQYKPYQQNPDLYNTDIKPVFKVVQIDNKIQFSAILKYTLYIIKPSLYLFISGYMEKIASDQTMIVLNIEDGLRNYQLYSTGLLIFIFGLGAIVQPFFIPVPFALGLSHYVYMNKVKIHMEQYHHSVILPIKEKLHGSQLK